MERSTARNALERAEAAARRDYAEANLEMCGGGDYYSVIRAEGLKSTLESAEAELAAVRIQAAAELARLA
jgi:hypothetical protein